MLVPHHPSANHPTRRRARTPRSRQALPATLAAGALLVALGGRAPALAQPQGGMVTSGEATISTMGGQTVINTTTQQTIIQFDSFNIGANESVTFNQPNANSAVLNQVQGSGESFINGALLSNGQVYIVNPAGVTFGRDAVVNVGRLVAAASVVSDEDFLAGIDRFQNSASTGNIQNFSDSILGNDGVVFVGRVVDNAGTVQANGGTVAMVVGRDILLSEGPEGQIFARIEGFNDPESRGPVFTDVINSGVIDNPNGDVLIGAGDLFAVSVLNTGRVNAQAFTLDTGNAPLILSEDSSQFSTISDNAMITINTARLEYFADAAPNERIWLNTPQGFINLSPDADPNVGPASLNGQPFPPPPSTLALTSTFVDRHATQLPIDPLALSGFDRVTPDNVQRQALADRFGLETTSFEDRLLSNTLVTSNLFDDLSANPGNAVISSERLSYSAAQDALDQYDVVFASDPNAAADAAGGLSNEEPGLAPVDQTQRVRSMLQEAADRYMADQEVTEIDPDAFASWLAASDPETLDALSGLSDLVNSTMPNLGLGVSELDRFKQWTYGKIVPRGLSPRSLDQLVAASARSI